MPFHASGSWLWYLAGTPYEAGLDATPSKKLYICLMMSKRPESHKCQPFSEPYLSFIQLDQVFNFSLAEAVHLVGVW